eukprot:g4604.t1
MEEFGFSSSTLHLIHAHRDKENRANGERSEGEDRAKDGRHRISSPACRGVSTPLSGMDTDSSHTGFTPEVSAATIELLGRRRQHHKHNTNRNGKQQGDTKNMIAAKTPLPRMGRDSLDSTSSMDTPVRVMNERMLPSKTPLLNPPKTGGGGRAHGRAKKRCASTLKKGSVAISRLERDDEAEANYSIDSAPSVSTPDLTHDITILPTKTPLLAPMPTPAVSGGGGGGDDDVAAEIHGVAASSSRAKTYDDDDVVDNDEDMDMEDEDDEEEEDDDEVECEMSTQADVTMDDDVTTNRKEDDAMSSTTIVSPVNLETFSTMPKYLQWQVSHEHLSSVIRTLNATAASSFDEQDDGTFVVSKGTVETVVASMGVPKLKAKAVILTLCKLGRLTILRRGSYAVVATADT